MRPIALRFLAGGASAIEPPFAEPIRNTANLKWPTPAARQAVADIDVVELARMLVARDLRTKCPYIVGETADAT